MAAVLVRRGTRLCCFHRELCRVVWRPQAALFSSNQSDRKQPRRTHIRKAKPQPAVDVSTLLEQIFSHRRPGTAPHASKSRTVQSSSISTKPPSTSSLKVSASNVPPLLKTEPAISAFPATSSLKQADGVVSPEHPPPQPKSTSQANLETSQDPLASLESEAPAVETVETKAGTEALDVSVPSKPGYTIDQTLETSSFHASTVEPVIKATVESQVDASPATVETITIEDPVEPAEDATVQSKSIQFPDTSQDPFASLESEALAVETVETEAGAETLDVLVLSKPAYTIDQTIEMSSIHASTLEPVIRIPLESQVDSSPATEETVFTASTAEDPVNPTEDAIVQSKSLHFPDISQDPLASLDSEVPVVETIETKADAEILDVPVLSTPGHTIDQTLEASSFCASAVDPVIKATLESQVDASPALVESIVTAAPVVQDPVDSTEDAIVHSKSFDSEVLGDLNPSKELPTIETTIESETEGAIGMTVEAEVVEAEAVVQVVQTNSTDSVQVEVLDVTKEESVMETTDSLAETRTSSLETEVAVVEGPAEPTTKPVSATAAENSRNAHESAAVPFKNESVVETSLGNVTVEEGVSETEGISIESVMMESLKIEELLQTQYVLVEEDEKQFQCMLDQTESETEHQTKNEKSPEPESENLTEVLSKWESLTEDLQDLEGETRMLEKQFLYNDPVRLSRVETGTMSDPPVEDILKMDEEVAEAESMTLESLILAEVKAEVGRLETEELRETCTALEKEEEVVPKEETGVKTAATDADLALESLLDASDTLKADASHILEAVIFSEQGPVVGQKLGPREEAIIQEVEKESQGEEYRVLDGITNEVAEIDVLLPTLESTYLSKTIDCLEKAPDVLAKEEKMEVEDAAALEGMIGALEVDSLSEADVEALPEALQSDVLMEELLCFASGSVAKDPVSRIAATGLASVDKEATVTDGVPDPPALGEIVPELEEVKEEAMQTEALEVLKDLDPVQRLFLEKIKEYNTHREAVVKEPDYERRLSEETAKLQRLYGGGDLNSFPQFTFTEPKMDQDTK
ncbi:uncharacterized protein LOC115433813 isoform X2 [Sphaeramia orbicularis]|uniref:uncharacterized protein LOC115433813 isoform X2 n=1 Tax=Sphaeramia orbicularis TaxID=375764 RepID=UPI00117EEA2C|nr:uncharacterized protein LOC115433813 isoform X2 [Sphaeramia orbicularis]